MFEIRFHGRGGQGSVVASDILARTVFLEGKDVQSFPFFGVERRGAPVTAYTRIDDKPIRIKTSIYEPDCVIVLDSSLIKSQNIIAGLKSSGIVLINSEKRPGEINLGFQGRIATVDATAIALKNNLGSKATPIVNTAILGALVKVTAIAKLESLVTAIKDTVPTKPEENAAAASQAYDLVEIKEAAG